MDTQKLPNAHRGARHVTVSPEVIYDDGCGKPLHRPVVLTRPKNLPSTPPVRTLSNREECHTLLTAQARC